MLLVSDVDRQTAHGTLRRLAHPHIITYVGRRRPGERYAVRIWLRASTLMEAETIALKYFPAGFRLERETPARRRGRPRKGATALVVWQGHVTSAPTDYP